MKTISESEYLALRAKIDRHEAWRNGRTSYNPSEVPTDCPDATNDQKSAVEVYEFVQNRPTRYVLYVNEQKAIATTWTGEFLGNVSFGRQYQSPGFGRCSIRVPITVHARNGCLYHGTYYKSAGDYARIKMAKNPQPL